MMEENLINEPNEIGTLVERELLKQIQDLYGDVTTTAKVKRTEREKLTKQFVEEYSKRSLLSEEKIRDIANVIIEREKWIKEIEEEDWEEER